MRVFVVGASGVIGSRLVPQLIELGHEVIGSARSPEKAGRLRRLEAESLVLDALDARAVREAVAAARPDAIDYQATALTGIGGNDLSITIAPSLRRTGSAAKAPTTCSRPHAKRASASSSPRAT
jgi:nucleoside-diphosphate-sugar epimerase